MPTLTLCSLASGSTGNCTYLATDETEVLIDAGISTKRIESALQGLGTSLTRIQGVCVTHEHSDHITALPVMQRKYGVPFYANAGTIQSAARKKGYEALQWKVFTNGAAFEIGDLTFMPYSIPHDAYDPVGFVIQWRETKIGFATDIGLPTNLIKAQLRGCHVLVLEANHDHQLLIDAPRPWSLKQRISGRQGHLSNDQAVDLLLAVAGPQLQKVYLAHLSAECNCPNVAMGTIRRALDGAGHRHIGLELTHPKMPSACFTLTEEG